MATYPPTTYQVRTLAGGTTPPATTTAGATAMTTDYVRTEIRTAAARLPLAAGGLFYRTQTQEGTTTYEGVALYTPAEAHRLQAAHRSLEDARAALATALHLLGDIDLRFGA